jgi:glycosyltransferase involved in cell wall biosynthesis
MPSISFIVPALNAQEHVAATVSTLQEVAARLAQYEIILVDDGSTDQTGKVMDDLAASQQNVRVVHNERNLGLGGAYKAGLAAACCDHVMGVWGDNSMPASSLTKIIEQVGKADSVISYVVNFHEIKTWPRYFGSIAYTAILNALFGLRVTYYNGYAVHRTDLLRKIEITSDGFGFQAEIILKLLRAGHSYVEVGVTSDAETSTSSALRVKNLYRVAKVLLHLIRTVPKFHSTMNQK